MSVTTLAVNRMQRFVTQAHAADIAIHSLEVSVAGRTVVRAGLAPFGPDRPHRLYSVAKSFTGLAIVLLAEEGRLALEDPIIDHFPEMAPVHPWLAATRIDDMLAMTGPHSRTTYDADGDDWLESYFRVTPTHRPGTLFTYDTSASYVLSALVERLTGGRILDYLRPRLFEPLGIGAGARFLSGPEGISHGGSGLFLAPGDLLPIAEVLNGRGMRSGSRILPERVVDRLLDERSDAGTQSWGAPLKAGYGRQLWLPAGGGWLMFGLGGQIVFGDPRREIAAVVTADATSLASGDQRLVEMLLAVLSDPLDDGWGPVVLTPPTPSHDAGNACVLRGTYALISGEGAPESLRIGLDEAGGVIVADAVTLTFSTEQPTTLSLALGSGAASAGWSAPGVLDVRVSAAAEDIALLRVRLVATDDGVVTVMSQGTGPATAAGWTWRGSYSPLPA